MAATIRSLNTRELIPWITATGAARDEDGYPPEPPHIYIPFPQRHGNRHNLTPGNMNFPVQKRRY
jgi:hypothetical protein